MQVQTGYTDTGSSEGSDKEWTGLTAVSGSASQKPKSRHANITPVGIHRPKITADKAINPRPATMPSE